MTITINIPDDLLQPLVGLITAGAKSDRTGSGAFEPAAKLLAMIQAAVDAAEAKVVAPKTNGHNAETALP